MSVSTLTTFNAYMKQLYADWMPAFSAIAKSPFAAAVEHNKKAHGSERVLPVEYGNGGGVSNTFATAQSETQGSQNAKFLVEWFDSYAIAQIQGDVEEFSMDNGAIVDALTREIDSKKEKLMNKLCSALYGDGTGRVGVSSQGDPASVPYITLANKYSVVNFKVGDTIAVAAQGGTSVRAGTAQITSIDRVNGVLNFGSFLTSSISAYTAGDNVYKDGDFGLDIQGLSGWLPGTALTSASFCSVNRTLDNVELAGWTHNFASGSSTIEDAIINAGLDLMTTDGFPDYCFMHPADWRKLVQSLSTLTRYNPETVSFEKDGAVYGFKYVEVLVGSSVVKCIADPFCPQGEGFLLQLDTWQLDTNGEAPKVWENDGLFVRAVYNADAVECRMVYRGNLFCKSPKKNSHIYFPVPIGR